MVRAILDGSKTQTRRVVKPRYIDAGPPAAFFQYLREVCPYGQAGDRLWVRETHFINDYRGAGVPEDERADTELVYAATDMDYVRNLEDDEGFAWRPSIHMPRWASRITLEVTGVRVERLQAISEADVHAEGCAGGRGSIPRYGYAATPTEHYRHLWETLNGAGAWDANPWVWVVEFERIKP